MRLTFEELNSDHLSFIAKKFGVFVNDIEDKRAKEYILTKPIKNALNMCILDNDSIMGFTSYVIEKNALYLAWTYIFPEFRKKGLGTEILYHYEKKAKSMKITQIYCKVNEDNYNSQYFSQKNGFKEIKRNSGEITYLKHL
ncbi:MAG: GNAT family N-acetyltransferase [Nanoarchaeota archaeon]|nr:GNAT family N-acetyltransferase [Nanoarchaeota archaeon]MEC8339670.1 GNAT family N-acetyltransferase [Nanoarchaeota archaeon]